MKWRPQAALCLAFAGAGTGVPAAGAACGAGYGAPLLPLVYHGRPLPEVIEEIQPYIRRHIVVDAAAAEFQYSGLVKQEDVEAWIRDLPAIYPVAVIDCRTSRRPADFYACTDPTLIVIRSRLNLYQNSLRSALR